MKKFKQLNQYEYLGLVSLLKDIFPFLDSQTCGTCNDNLINIQNTYTQYQPNDKFCLLGAFGLTEGHDIVLEYWDTEEENSSFITLLIPMQEILSLQILNLIYVNIVKSILLLF